MKITKTKLMQIIREELALIAEQLGFHGEPQYHIMPMADIEAAFRNAGRSLPPYGDLKRMQSEYENTPEGRRQLERDVQGLRGGFSGWGSRSSYAAGAEQ